MLKATYLLSLKLKDCVKQSLSLKDSGMRLEIVNEMVMLKDSMKRKATLKH
jgi:hypothetical protein